MGGPVVTQNRYGCPWQRDFSRTTPFHKWDVPANFVTVGPAWLRNHDLLDVKGTLHHLGR